MENKQVKLGIIGAMDVEVATLMEHAHDAAISERAGMRFCEGTLAGMPVVIAKCGIGKVSAGMCVQVMCDLYGVTHIVNTGVAGSLDAAIDIADLVVSLAEYTGVRSTFAYTMSKVDPETGRSRVVFTGTSQHCFVNPQGRPMRVDRELPAFDAALKEELAKNEAH